MIKRTIKIGSWVVDFLFAVGRYDIEGVLGCLYDAGAPEWAIDQAEVLMMEDNPNCGFTMSNPDRHRAVVVLGPTTSGDEFTNTFVHEVHHLAVAIASELGIDLESETPAYVAGDSAKALADVVCEFGCPCCNK